MLFFVVYAWVHSFIAGYFTPVRSSVCCKIFCQLLYNMWFFFLLKSFLESRSEYPKHLLHNPLLKQNDKKKILLAISILFSAKYRSQLQRFYRFSFMCFIAHVLLIYYNFFSSCVQIWSQAHPGQQWVADFLEATPLCPWLKRLCIQ